MKVACLGGGGFYFAGPIGDIAACRTMHGTEISLYDVDNDRAELMAKMGRRLSREAGAKLRMKVAGSMREAIEGSDFVLCSIGGVGGSGAGGYYRSPIHLGDKLICSKYGIYQMVGDTCGPAAMMAAFRCVPIYLDICRKVEKHAPDAVVMNHANPMAVLCRAMVKYSGVRSVIGVCHGVQEGTRQAAELIGIPATELETVWIGTNHYYWFTRMRHKGEDVLPKLWKKVKDMKTPVGHKICAELSRIYGHWIVYPEDDHIVEFYPYLAQMKDETDFPAGLEETLWGGRVTKLYNGTETVEDVREHDRTMPRKEILRLCKEVLDGVQVPEFDPETSMHEATVPMMAGIASGERKVCIANIPNEGAVPNLPAEAVLEVEAVTDSAGVRPLHMGRAPLALEALLRKWIAWQELVADAAATGDRKTALQALQVDETAISPDKSRKMLNELLANSKGMLPTFEKKRR